MLDLAGFRHLLASPRFSFSLPLRFVASYNRSAMAPDKDKIVRDTAEEKPAVIDWEKLAASNRFRKLLQAKRRFIVPAMLFFIVYYFALPVLIGYARPLMETRVLGPVNLAYLFALSQFFMAWTIAALYVRAAARFDKMAADVIASPLLDPDHKAKGLGQE